MPRKGTLACKIGGRGWGSGGACHQELPVSRDAGGAGGEVAGGCIVGEERFQVREQATYLQGWGSWTRGNGALWREWHGGPQVAWRQHHCKRHHRGASHLHPTSSHSTTAPTHRTGAHHQQGATSAKHPPRQQLPAPAASCQSQGALQARHLHAHTHSRTQLSGEGQPIHAQGGVELEAGVRCIEGCRLRASFFLPNS